MARGCLVEPTGAGSSGPDDGQPFVLGEVPEVLDVQRRQGQVVVQAARGYPHVVLRARPTTPLSVSCDRAPGTGHVLDLVVVRQDQDVAQPGFQATAVGRTPLAIDGPLGQLRQRDERDAQPVVEDGRDDRWREVVTLDALDATSVSRTTKLNGYPRSARRAA